MAFTFDINLSRDLDRVRWLVGDTDGQEYDLTDETVNALLTMYGSVNGAAIAAVDGILTRLAKDVTRNVNGIGNITASDKYRHYTEIRTRLRATVGILAIPEVPALSVATKEAYDADTSQVQPFFTRKLGDVVGTADNPETA